MGLKKLFSDTTFLAIIACLLWSTSFVAIKTGLSYTTPIHFAGIRFFLAGLIVLPFAVKAVNLRSEIKNNIRIIIVITFLQIVFQYSFFFLGLDLVPAALGAIIIGSQPLFVALIAHFSVSNDKLTIKKLLIFLMGLLGIVFVSFERAKFISAGETKIAGIFLLIGVNIIYSFSNIIISKDGDHINPLVLSSLTMILGGIILFVVSIPIEGLKVEIKPPDFYVSLLWLSFLSSIVMSVWFSLLKRPGVKVSDLNFWKFIIPVLGVILSWLILPDEKPGIVPLTGMFIVTFSLILLNLYKARE